MRPCKHVLAVLVWFMGIRSIGQSQAPSQSAVGQSPAASTAPSIKTTDAASAGAVAARLQPSPQMQKLFDAFGGDWTVSEAFATSSSRQGKSRAGVASFRAGPGFTLIEDYKSNGSAGELNFLALLWWDESAQLYRLLTCANNDGCELRGTARWEGNALVNSWQKNVNGKTAAFRDSFESISPSGFRLVSEGSADGKPIWRVITEYKRKRGAR